MIQGLPVLEPVRSSHLSGVAYDEATARLIVEFRDGRLYRYDDVPPEVHEHLMAAESKGKAYHQLVQCGGFACHKME